MTLPPGYYLHPDTRCPVCRRAVAEVDRIEGLPIYMCPDLCRDPTRVAIGRRRGPASTPATDPEPGATP